jgi:hypothetical protein
VDTGESHFCAGKYLIQPSDNVAWGWRRCCVMRAIGYSLCGSHCRSLLRSHRSALRHVVVPCGLLSLSGRRARSCGSNLVAERTDLGTAQTLLRQANLNTARRLRTGCQRPGGLRRRLTVGAVAAAEPYDS